MSIKVGDRVRIAGYQQSGSVVEIRERILTHRTFPPHAYDELLIQFDDGTVAEHAMLIGSDIHKLSLLELIAEAAQ